MIERHVTFDLFPDQTAVFEDFFTKEYRPAMASMPGFISVHLLRKQKNPLSYQMVIRFDSPENAAAWRASPLHLSLSPKLKALYSTSLVEVYEVIA
jgi:antibiotic biosynthesis monooxygenase (ABM) superfamily enzyme